MPRRLLHITPFDPLQPFVKTGRSPLQLQQVAGLRGKTTKATRNRATCANHAAGNIHAPWQA
eukprot:3080798-Amphidinium_carterae.1